MQSRESIEQSGWRFHVSEPANFNLASSFVGSPCPPARAAAGMDKPLADLESEICQTLVTLDRIDRFAQADNPDNRIIPDHLDKLVRGLSQVSAASGQTKATVPAALVREFVDAGRSPDDFSAAQLDETVKKADTLALKQQAIGMLADTIRESAADMLRPP